MNRREVLKAGSGAAIMSALTTVGLFGANSAHAASTWNDAQFAAKSLDEVLKAFGVASAADSKDIAIHSPDIAENGAVVPIGVKSSLANTQKIALLVEKNPALLAGLYTISDGAEADVSMRVKMGQSSDVIALVQADGKWVMTRKEVKVTLGGCGG